MPQRRIDERRCRADLSLCVLSSRASSTIVFSYLLPDDAMRRSRLPHFFRAVYAHMGEHGRIVTVRNDATSLRVAWLTTGGYPCHTRAAAPGALFASDLYRRPGPSRRAIGNAALLRAHRKIRVVLDGLCAIPQRSEVASERCCSNNALAQVDAEGVGSHLETPRLDNVAYYKRFATN